jgi:hypothetical protein
MQVADRYGHVAPGRANADGLAASRRRIRRRGPVVALVPPALLLGLAFVLWRVVPCQGAACRTQGAGGWLAALMALPTTLATGLPWESDPRRYAIAIGTSALLWMLLGRWAARRASRRPITGWREYWREYLWFLIPVWFGVVAALGVIAVGLGTLEVL